MTPLERLKANVAKDFETGERFPQGAVYAVIDKAYEMGLEDAMSVKRNIFKDPLPPHQLFPRESPCEGGGEENPANKYRRIIYGNNRH